MLSRKMSDYNSEVLRGQLLDDINREAESERKDTAELYQLEQVVAIKRAALITKRENLAKLERKAASLLAAKVVDN